MCIGLVTSYLLATECATFLQLTSHSLSLKKLITDCMHSFKASDKPWSSRSKKILIITARKSAASEVEKRVLTLLQMHKGIKFHKRPNLNLSKETIANEQTQANRSSGNIKLP